MKNVVFLLLCLFSFSAHAGLIKTDLNTAGDGLLVLDTDTNLEWALVTRTGTSVNHFYNNSIYSGLGFTVADATDLLTLFENAGATGLTAGVYHYGDQYDAPAHFIYELMEFTAPYTEFGGNHWIHAWYDNGNGLYSTGRVGWDGDTYIGQSSFMIGNNNYSNRGASQGHSAYSVWAHRPAAQVPEPSSIALLAIGLLGLRISRKKIVG